MASNNRLSDVEDGEVHACIVPHDKFSDVVICHLVLCGWLGSRVVSVLDSGAEGPGFKSQPQRCWVTVLGKLFTPIVFTKQQNWVVWVTTGLVESNGSLPLGL